MWLCSSTPLRVVAWGKAGEAMQIITASYPEMQSWVLKQTLLHSYTQCTQWLDFYVIGSTEECNSARQWVEGRKSCY